MHFCSETCIFAFFTLKMQEKTAGRGHQHWQDAETFTLLPEGHPGPQVVLNIRMEQGCASGFDFSDSSAIDLTLCTIRCAWSDFSSVFYIVLLFFSDWTTH